MRYTRKLINRKRKKIRNMRGGTNAQKESIKETLKLAKQIAFLSFVDTYSNTSQMEDLLTQIQNSWENANSGENILNMSKNVTHDEESQLRDLELKDEIEEELAELEKELAELEKEFKNEGKGIKTKKKRITKKRRKQKGGGQIEDLNKAVADLNIALQNMKNYRGDINTKKGIERNLLYSKLLLLRKIKELESRPPPPPSRNSSSRRSATRKSKSVFGCFPGMSCTNAKGKKKKRRRRTRRKR